MMYVPSLASRRQGLDMLDDLEKGRHLDLPFMHLEKCAALIIEPQSTGMITTLHLKTLLFGCAVRDRHRLYCCLVSMRGAWLGVLTVHMVC